MTNRRASAIETFLVAMLFCSWGVSVQAAECYPDPGGLVAWWPGDGTPEDLVGNNDGTVVNGVTFAPGLVAEAFQLDGLDAYVQTPSPVLTTPPYTICAWVDINLLPAGATQHWILENGGGTSDSHGFGLKIDAFAFNEPH